MHWNEIRDRYPRQWLLVEALKAHSEAGRRVLDDLAVLQSFPDSRVALESYKEHHRQDRQRELYVLHTDRERLDIEEAHWFGLRIS